MSLNGPLGSESPNEPTIVSVGELLWDLFPDGPRLGGASANVAFHAARLGARSTLVSRVGRDRLGGAALRHLEASGVGIDHVQVDPSHPTGQVRVTFERGQPSFAIGQEAAWDRIELGETLRRRWLQADVICFGTLLQRTSLMKTRLSRELARLRAAGHPQLPKHSPYRRPRLFLDLNLRWPHVETETVWGSLALADVVKMNDQELDWLAQHEGTRDPLHWLFDSFGVRMIALTHGAHGATLLTRVLRIEVEGLPVQEGDPVGAGDAFVASLARSLALDRALPRALYDANRYAAWVASQAGAMPSGQPLWPVD